jgi:hypothetical protein
MQRICREIGNILADKVKIFRNFTWRNDPNPFLASGFPLFEQNLSFRDAKYVTQEGDQGLVGAAFHGGGGKADFQAVADRAGEGGFTGARLDGELEHEVRAVPAEPGHDQGPRRKWFSASWAIWSTTSTTSGERSRPPTGGISRRAGRSSGSVRLASRLPAGVCRMP